MAKRRPAPCALCHQTAVLTDEDVWPRWAREALATVHVERQRPQKTLLRICWNCNQAMSRIFEDPAAPVFKRIMWGQNTFLRPEELQTVAAWMVKTNALLGFWRGALGRRDGLSPDLQEETRLQVLSMISKDGAIPDHTVVAVGLGLPGHEPALHRPFLSERWETLAKSHWVSSILPLGLLLAFVVRFADSPGAGKLADHLNEDGRFVLLAPNMGTASWPPPQRLTVDAHERLAAELGHDLRAAVGGGWHLRVRGV